MHGINLTQGQKQQDIGIQEYKKRASFYPEQDAKMEEQFPAWMQHTLIPVLHTVRPLSAVTSGFIIRKEFSARCRKQAEISVPVNLHPAAIRDGSEEKSADVEAYDAAASCADDQTVHKDCGGRFNI